MLLREQKHGSLFDENQLRLAAKMPFDPFTEIDRALDADGLYPSIKVPVHAIASEHAEEKDHRSQDGNGDASDDESDEDSDDESDDERSDDESDNESLGNIGIDMSDNGAVIAGVDKDVE